MIGVLPAEFRGLFSQRTMLGRRSETRISPDRMRAMDLVFDIATSMEFWRRVYPADRVPKPAGSVTMGDCACSRKDVERLLPAWATDDFLAPLGGVVHVTVFDVREKRKSATCVVHVRNGRLPEGSHYRLNDSALIASPAFIFLCAATVLNFSALVALGCELCGFYGFDSSRSRGFRKRRAPLLTVERLRAFLEQARHYRGWKTATRALPFIVERSASPMETFDVLAMCLPYRYGGYSLRKPIMNEAVELTSKAAHVAKRSVCYPDMCYIDAKRRLKVDIEHHGKFDHSTDDDWDSDRARVNGLKEMGFEVIELTNSQVKDLETFEIIIQRIAKLIGKQVRKEHCGATPARLEFRRAVIEWNRSYGRLS